MVVASSDCNKEGNSMNVAMIGTGYVGLVTGACLADIGHHVICVDTDADKIQRLRDGHVPIFEPGLEALVERNQQAGQLMFTTDLVAAVQQATVVFIAVGTPSHEDGSADVCHVIQAATDIGAAITDYTVIINKSTVPVGTVARIRQTVSDSTARPFSVVSNPEFLKQGNAIEDFMHPDRIVIGVDDDYAANCMRELYASIITTASPLLEMDCASAELCKYASNAMLATRISFMNEIAHVCDRVGADVDQVRRAMGADSRIGPEFLRPGLGYGGSCFPKDVAALVSFAGKKDYDFRILRAVERVNGRQKKILFNKIFNHFKGSLHGRTIAVWGLAFKPNTDDMREAPSITLIEYLLYHGARVRVYDPRAMGSAKAVLGPDVIYVGTSYGALSGADALALVTEWDEFRDPDVARMRAALKTPVIFDGRNLYDAEDMRDRGMTYYSIGRQ
jgi:UDPglucose 6-dehydrogenase